MMTPYEKLKIHFGGVIPIAKHFGLTRQAVDVWAKKGIPTNYALAIEKDTKGAILAMEILEAWAKNGPRKSSRHK